MRERMRAGRFGPVEIIAGEYCQDWHMVRSCSLWIDSHSQRAIVDPAADESRLAVLVPSATLCINSHAHADHILFNPMFPHVPLFAPAADAHFYKPSDLEELGPDGDLLVGSRVSRRRGQFVRTPDRLLGDGEQLAVGDVEIRVVGLPGHTPGMLGFHFPAQRLFYIADFDLTDFGPWYGNASSDPDRFFASARRIQAIDADFFLTAHEVGIVRRDELEPLIARFLGHIGQRDEVILGFLQTGPRSLDELSQGGVAYARRAVAGSPWNRLWERQHVRKHLSRLLARGAVGRTEQGHFYKR
ncbi:MAG TPA: MBL fold metallo-hydrolase [Polyangia bacterium]|nr:MBL fold metallo-hydrolase [Polyangia bacterium]